MEEGKRSTALKVLMLPWLAHGHMSAFLELAKRLAIRNFHIYIYSTPVILTSIKNKITDEYSRSIELVELHLPSSPELPPHYHTTNGLPPHLMAPLQKAYKMSRPQFSNILTSLQPDLVIYDFIQSWAAEIASSKDIPAVQFLSISATFAAFRRNVTEVFPEIYVRDYERLKNQGKGNVQFTDVKEATERSHQILLVKTCREIEGKYIDFLSTLSNKKVVPVGPLVQDFATDDDHDNEHKEIIAWLDQKEKGSVVYASFGSEYFLTKEERDVISQGLELSNVNFIWVVRFPLGEKINIQDALPEGFLDRIGNRGKIVERWAPQAKILKHSSTGGFVSHCGWNSVMESVKWGVPIIAMPMHIDQPVNSRVVEAVGVGIEAIRDEKGNLQSEEIAKAIRKVMVEESGENVRRKAKELSEKLEMKGDEEIDSLAEELLLLCQKK